MDPASVILLSMIGISLAGSCCAIYNDMRADEELRTNLITCKRNYYYTFKRKKKGRSIRILSPIPEGIEQ
jgi:hypothetical protein